MTGSVDFSEIYDAHFDEILRFLKRRIVNPSDALELAQDVFCNSISAFSKSEVEQPRAYLFRAARNITYNWKQREFNAKSSVHFSIDDDDGLEVVCSAPSPEKAAYTRQRLALVEKAIEAMPEKRRMVFVLVRFEDHSYAQAAKYMGLTVKSVEYHIREAVKDLQNMTETESL